MRGPGEERCDDFSSRDLYPNVLAAWKETGCASAHESCGGLPAGTESDTEDTEPGGAP